MKLNLLLITLSILVFTPQSQAASLQGVQEAVSEAQNQKLYFDPQWLKLVHYEKGILWGYKGDVASPGFYLAHGGRTDPEAELVATLRGMYSDALHEFEDLYEKKIDKMAVRCQFPARSRFLIERLKLDPKKMPAVDCSRFEKYRDSFQARSVYLVFSSYYLNNPSSAFGHTFLRFSKSAPGSQESTKSELLDTGISNAAELTSDNAILYAVGGLAGFFRGVYTKLPYYYKVREYNDFEARDLYSYELNLNQSEIDLLVAHLWEVGAQFSRYYYLKQNCAYQILSVIEAAAPRYDLLSQLKFYVIPADTARVVVETPDLVRRQTFRPSIRSVFFNRLSTMTAEEIDAVEDWAVDRKKPTGFGNLPVATRARILDAAVDYVDFKFAKDVILEKNENSAYRDTLLKERAALGVRSEPLLTEADSQRNPTSGHPSSRLGIAGGREKSVGKYVQADVRFALNHLLDSPTGYPESAQIGFADWAFRWLTEAQRFEVEQIRLIDVNSLSPYSRFVKNKSFKIDIKVTRFRDANCDRCFGGQIEGGLGIAFDLGRKEFPVIVFGHAEAEGAYAPGFNGSNFRLGAGPGVGALLGGEKLRLLATWSPRALLFSRDRFYYKQLIEGRYSPTDRFSFGAGWETVDRNWQSSLKGYFYF